MVLPEKRKELIQTLHSIVAHVIRIRGCLNAGFYQDVENENSFLVLEEWASHDDAEDHERSDIFTVLIGAGSLMLHPPEITVHTVNRTSRGVAA